MAFAPLSIAAFAHCVLPAGARISIIVIIS